MTRLTALCAGTALMVLLVACTSAEPTASGEEQLLELDSYENSHVFINTWNDLPNANSVNGLLLGSASQCMKREGFEEGVLAETLEQIIQLDFEYLVELPVDRRPPTEAGYLWPEAPQPVELSFDSPIPENTNADQMADPEFSTAFLGETATTDPLAPDSSGCLSEALREALESVFTDNAQMNLDAINAAYNLNFELWTVFDEIWAECMRAQGYEYSSVSDPFAEFGAVDFQPGETAVVAADLSCRITTAANSEYQDLFLQIRTKSADVRNQ